MSMRKAINEKCKDCIYDQCAPGTWRQQVQACTIQSCSLWQYRPKSKPSNRAATVVAASGSSVHEDSESLSNVSYIGGSQ